MELPDRLLYVFSLPERTIRSLAAGIGGVSKLATDTLLPRSVRTTNFYTYFLGNTQRFVIEGIGQVDGAYAKETGALPGDYLAKKVVGNVADVAGMFAFHFSPLWFFALVGDAAGGTKTYLQRITGELKKDGVLAADATITSAEELLDALNVAASRSAVPIDTPPLSKEELLRLKDEIKGGYALLYEKSRAAVPDPATLWALIEKTRQAEPVPFLRICGAMAMSGSKAVGRASGDLFWEKVVCSYQDSLDEVKREGYGTFFTRVSAPYLAAATSAFSPERETLTQKLLSGSLWKRSP